MMESERSRTLNSDDKMNAKDLLTLAEAAKWASDYLNREVSVSNISYLVQYARIRKIRDSDEGIRVDRNELKEYYDKLSKEKAVVEKRLGMDLDWELAFNGIPEYERTKHVHRLHPYKGKFIPQLVEYFLDKHKDSLKTDTYFEAGDIVLDPFMGSGTTLVVASELGINSIGVDISEFNCLIAKAKVDDYTTFDIDFSLKMALDRLDKFAFETFDDNFDIELKQRIQQFNKEHFPNPQYKWRIREGEIDEKKYSQEKLDLFFRVNKEFFDKNGTKDRTHLIDERQLSSFVVTWFTHRIRQEIAFYKNLIDAEESLQAKNLMKIILSRTARSCRATTHSDLATLQNRRHLLHRRVCRVG